MCGSCPTPLNSSRRCTAVGGLAAAVIAIAGTATAQAAAIGKSQTPERRFVVEALGGIGVEVMIWESDSAAQTCCIDAVTARIEALENKLTIWKYSSGVSALNRAAGSGPQLIDADIANLLGVVRRVHRESAGAFDPTISAFGLVWRRAEERGTAPTDDELALARQAVGFDRVTYRPQQGTVEMPCGFALDFGGVAKGYIVDCVAEYLIENGVVSGAVRVGGEVRVFGDRPLRIGLRDPSGDPDALAGALTVTRQAVSTSGNYERFRLIGDKAYGHVIDPHTGRPADGLLSATVIASSAAEADALATAVFVRWQRGFELAERLDDVEAVLIARAPDGSLTYSVTSGIRWSLVWYR